MIRNDKGQFVKGVIPYNKDRKKYTFNCLECGKEVKTSDGRNSLCSKSCGSKYSWKHTKSRERKGCINKGYLRIQIDNKRLYEQDRVWMLKHDIDRIPKGFVVHHFDLDKLNNSPENLILLPISYHHSYHNKLKGGILI